MTTERYQRCAHCGVEYIYQGSGHGAPEFNHGTWCHGCYQTVCEALKNRPRIYECRYQNITVYPQLASVTLDRVLAWERQNIAERDARGDIPVTRIFSPLFDLNTGDSQYVRQVVGREEFQGVPFKLATWKKKPEYDIEVPMEYDVQKECFTRHPWPVGSRGFPRIAPG